MGEELYLEYILSETKWSFFKNVGVGNFFLRLAIAVLQKNIRKYLFLRNWKWWRLYTKVKPLLNVARSEDELRQKEEELNKMREQLLKEQQSRKEMDEQQTELLTEKNELFIQLQRVCIVPIEFYTVEPPKCGHFWDLER